MKSILIVAAALALAACASPRTAKIEDGKVINITSAEATTLMKQEIRRTKVEDVQKNAKPIFELKAKAGQKIEISGVESITVNVPQDLRELLAEQASEVSENVQVLREVRGIGKDVVVPLGVAGLVVSDRKNASNNAARIEEARSAERTAQTEAMTSLASDGMEAAAVPTTIVTVPAGSSVLPAATP